MQGAIVVGAGPAGLATSRELLRRRVEHVVLERGRIGESWRRCYHSLRLHTGRHLSHLPGLPFPPGTPLFPTRDQLVAYLESYARTFRLPIREHSPVSAARHDGDHWQIRLGSGEELAARALVISTGIMANPYLPDLPERARFNGQVLHSIEYHAPEPYLGRRVLVVGIGNSGGEIASELAGAGVDVTVAVRSGANVVPLTLLGLPIQYHSWALQPLPRSVRVAIAATVRRLSDARRGRPPFPRPAHSPVDAIPLIGFHLVDAIRSGRVALAGQPERFTATGVRFAGGSEQAFDAVIFATGFRPALGLLGAAVRTDGKGFALRADRIRSADLPGLVFVGHNYDSVGGLRNICRDAPRAAEAVRLAQEPALELAG
jgi:cation diffusion facilitator CzcD-associated flavoprotein CzcO